MPRPGSHQAVEPESLTPWGLHSTLEINAEGWLGKPHWTALLPRAVGSCLLHILTKFLITSSTWPNTLSNTQERTRMRHTERMCFRFRIYSKWRLGHHFCLDFWPIVSCWTLYSIITHCHFPWDQHRGGEFTEHLHLYLSSVHQNHPLR